VDILARDLLNLWLVASDHPSPKMSNLTPADVSLIDAALGYSAGDTTSGTNTYDELRNVTIGNDTYEAYTVATNSYSGEYMTAAMHDGTGLVYVSQRVIGGLGYKNGESEFQFLVPAGIYYLSYYTTESLNCSIPLNLTSHLHNGTYTYLRWDPIPGAERYNVYYIDDIGDPNNASRRLLNFSDATVVSGITNNSWIDPVPVPQRYYQVKAAAGITECNSTVTAGRLEIPLTRAGGVGYNFVSIPFVPANDSFTEFIKPILSVFRQAFWYNNVGKSYRDYTLFCFMGTCVPLDNIHIVEPNRVYWIEVTSDTVLPVTGVFQNSTSLTLTPEYSGVGFHVIEGNRQAASVLQQIYPSLDSAYEYNNTIKGYSQFSVFCFMGSCVPIEGFDTIEPATGYWIDIRVPDTLQWP
jgi:hypothetical protein